MTQLMANEGIRLPSDSTVASKTVHRGNPLPEQSAATPQGAAPEASKPLLTVVLQTNRLLQGTKGQLVELLLQNDPKSEPPIRVQSKQLLAPGTPLILEQTSPGQFYSIPPASSDQVVKLVQLELEFWKAQLLPKSGHRVFPPLPTPPELSQLAAEEPELKPLEQWLNQRPQRLNGQTVQQWFRETVPLSPLRAWSSQNPAVYANVPARAWQSSGPFSAPPNQHSPASVSSDSKSSPTPPAAMQGALQPPRSGIAASERPVLAPANAGTAPAAERAASTQSQPATAVTTLNASAQRTATEVLPPSALPAQRPNIAPGSTPPLGQTGATDLPPPNNELPRPTVAVKSVAARPADLEPQKSPTSTQPTQVGAGGPPSPTIGAKVSAETAMVPTVTTAQSTVSSSVASASLSHNRAGAQLTGTDATLTSGAQSSSLQTAGGGSASAPADGLHQRLLSPLREPSNPAQRGRMPLEVVLQQWHGQVNDLIQRSPVHLSSQLRAEAQAAIQQNIESSTAAEVNDRAVPNRPPAESESSILQLRNWLEASLARLQSNAVQLATAQWSQSDAPIQQMQLPLIWLGLTSWAEIEWWQERPQKQKKEEAEQQQRRRWRMKIYMTLSPLAPLCADIDWATDSTQLTLWSEDAATLQHLQSLLPRLQEWTEGLGERQLLTKHGMPKRAQQKTRTATQQSLVDIRT